MARVRCLTIARDERLLDAWIRYHAYQFGFGGLTIVASDQPSPLLERASGAGAEVRHVAALPTDVDALLALLEGEGTPHDFAAPLECDEFLAVQTSDGVSCRRDRVHAALEPLRSEWRALSFAPGLVSTSGPPNEFAVEPTARCIVPARAGMGALTVPGRRSTALTSIRLRETLTTSDVRVIFQGLANLLDALGIRDERLGVPVATPRAGPDDTVWVRTEADGRPVRFKASAYRRAHEDVAATEWPPFMHYAWSGLRERRRLS